MLERGRDERHARMKFLVTRRIEDAVPHLTHWDGIRESAHRYCIVRTESKEVEMRGDEIRRMRRAMRKNSAREMTRGPAVVILHKEAGR